MSELLVTADRGHDIPLGPVTPSAYRAFLASGEGAELGPGFLQCPSWAQVKDGWRSQLVGWGPEPESGGLSGAALVLLRQLPGTRKYFAYLPEGPVADWADPDIDGWLRPLLRHLRALGAFAVRIGPSPAYRTWTAARLKSATGPGRRLSDVLASRVDPLGMAVAERLRARGWQRCGGEEDGDAQPRHVFQVPLAGRGPDDLWSGLNQEWRRNVRRAEKAGVEVVVGGEADLPEFYRLLRITEERDGFRLGRSLEYYERQYAALNAEEPGRMRLYLARHGGETLAAHTMVHVGRRVWYQTGASASHRREVRPSNLLQWRMLLDAHALGAEVYDMRGVPSTLDPDDRSHGLLRWKLGTGGEVVQTLGEWERPLDGTANYALYRAFQAYLARR
ncbi:aminoacyltransferase [Streptomyces sp. NBC_00234]|uniref:lipid II:glycine glycyltransferase FemX n=1 Tax=Streptomyces sp. NBC_00234 TaxID=2903638 RepID=UPI002E29A017|nr:peptidoglycan bridge formation glycyltransferase FemA/FemB family protein [Streptomyces sp. NBC_00234]